MVKRNRFVGNQALYFDETPNLPLNCQSVAAWMEAIIDIPNAATH